MSCFGLLNVSHSSANLVGVLGAFGRAAQVTSDHFAVLDRVERGLFDAARVVIQVQVSQHHDTAEQQCGRVGLVLSGNVGRSSVDL
jgi:hypothetical protein